MSIYKLECCLSKLVLNGHSVHIALKQQLPTNCTVISDCITDGYDDSANIGQLQLRWRYFTSAV